MSTVLQHKRSSTSGLAPTTSQLAFGELAINSHDGTLFLKKDAGAGEVIVTIRDVTTASINDLTDVDTSTAAPVVGQYLKWDGVNWIPATVSGGSGGATYAEQTVLSQTYTGNGSTVNFDTGIIPEPEVNVMVMLNGLVQDPSTYSLSGSTITFAVAPANGDNVELRTFSGFSTSVSFNNYHAYRFTVGTNTTTISGTDDNGDTLAYTAGRIEVYVNGVRLAAGTDYTATNGTTITIGQTIFAGSVVEVVSLAAATLLNQALEIQTESIALTSTTANQPVASFSALNYRTAKFLVQMSHASAGYHATEVLVIHNGSTVFTTEYGTIYTIASLGTVDAQITSGNVQLTVTPANTNTTVKTKRISVEA